MDVLSIKESVPGLFSMLLPPCDALVLRDILQPNLRYVWLIDVPAMTHYAWVESNLPPLLNLPPNREARLVRQLQIDISLSTADFLAILPGLATKGLIVLQADKPLPRTLVLDRLADQSRARVYRTNSILFEFELPHAGEHALLTSVDRVFLNVLAAKLKPWSQAPNNTDHAPEGLR